MKSLDNLIDEAYSELKSKCGKVRNDYFGLVYLENELNVPRAKAINQIAFGGNEFGVDGYHFDLERKNFYIFQFKNSTAHSLFKESLPNLIDKGLEAIFSDLSYDKNKNQIINQLRSSLIENREIIKQICFRFIFIGDPDEAERSQVLDKLREDLENKKYLIDRFFNGQQATLIFEFRSFSGKVGSITDQRKTNVYEIPLHQVFAIVGPLNETMHLCLIRLIDLYRMNKDMGDKFFERNIRYGLGTSEAVNKAILRSLKTIVIDHKELPEIFTFNHNGITLFAEQITPMGDSTYRVVAPRLLNGAQTITTFKEFIESNQNNPKFIENADAAESLRVLCKIITNANQNFITNVTINNNRQNPVEPWNLHANDMIQLHIQDKFRDELQIYYERQENAFDSIDLEEEGISEAKAIEFLKLTQTFLITDGNIQRVSNMRQVFEDENIYAQVFNENRLKADCRQIVLCYKIPFRLRKLQKDIIDKGFNKYSYVPKARLLLWALLSQAVLNDDQLEARCEEFGSNMTLATNYTEYLSNLATTKCRYLLSELTGNEKFSGKFSEGNFSFLKSNSAYEFCMNIARDKWNWSHKKLK